MESTGRRTASLGPHLRFLSVSFLSVSKYTLLPWVFFTGCIFETVFIYMFMDDFKIQRDKFTHRRYSKIIGHRKELGRSADSEIDTGTARDVPKRQNAPS